MKWEDAAVIAVVGVAKNCGKTTSMNAMVDRMVASGRKVGLLSIGIDGEARDALLGTSKPAIKVVPGTCVATCEPYAEHSPCDFELLGELGWQTPLGKSVVVRARSAGEVVLGGMRTRKDVSATVRALRSHGCEQVWIDGAYGRIAAAQPGIAEVVVVATGAVVGGGIRGVVDRTRALVDRLEILQIEEPWHVDLMERARADERALLGSQTGNIVKLSGRSALVSLRNSDDLWTPQISAIAIPGLVSDRVAHFLTKRKRGGTLLIGDPTSLQVDARVAKQLAKSWDVRALHTSYVAAITYNPTALRGPRVDGAELGRALQGYYPNKAVFDPLVGLQ